MKRFAIIRNGVAAISIAAVLTLTIPPVAVTAAQPGAPVVVAQAGGTEPRELEPRYKPVPPEPQSSYNSSYIFGMTRGLANSTIHPAAKAPLFLFTVPLDFVFFPFAAIGGFFG